MTALEEPPRVDGRGKIVFCLSSIVSEKRSTSVMLLEGTEVSNSFHFIRLWKVPSAYETHWRLTKFQNFWDFVLGQWTSEVYFQTESMWALVFWVKTGRDVEGSSAAPHDPRATPNIFRLLPLNQSSVVALSNFALWTTCYQGRCENRQSQNLNTKDVIKIILKMFKCIVYSVFQMSPWDQVNVCRC